MKHLKVQQLVILTLSIWLMPAFMLHAAQIKWKQQLYSHFADGQPLETTLKDLMSGESIPVVLSKKLKSTVHVHLENLPPAEVLERLTKMYHFVWYYDGQVLFVNEMSELQSATLKLKHISSKAFTQALKDLDIYDGRFSWQYSEREGLVYFSGPPRLVSLVMEMAKVYDIEERNAVYKWVDSKGVPTFSTAPPVDESKGFDIISPLTGQIIKNQSGLAVQKGG